MSRSNMDDQEVSEITFKMNSMTVFQPIRPSSITRDGSLVSIPETVPKRKKKTNKPGPKRKKKNDGTPAEVQIEVVTML